MYINLCKSLEKYLTIMPVGIEQIADSFLCLLFAGGPFTEAHIEALSHAIPGMKGIFWKRNFVAKRDVEDTYTLTTAQLLETSDKNLVKSIIDYSGTNAVDRNFHQKFSRILISWIEGEQIKKVAEAYSRSVIYDRAIAIIPHNDEAAWQWGNITYGLAWYSLWSLSRPQRRLDEEVFLSDEFLQIYLRLTNHIGGIPSLPFSDVDAQPGLVFYGRFEHLEQIHKKLSEVATPFSDDEFEAYYRRNGPSLRHRAGRI